WRLRFQLRRTRYSISALSLFLATDLDVAALGLDSGNYWSYAHDDLDAIYGLTGADLDAIAEPPGAFVTVTTLKDPSKRHKGHHTLEAFTFVRHDAFRAFASSRYGDRPPAYAALKADLRARMIRAASRV